MQDIFYIFDVNGAAIEASASLKDTPKSAAFKAPQSFAPSPHIPHKTFLPIYYKHYNNRAFSLGFILANIEVLSNIKPNNLLSF